jgi:hypothetical protein
MKDDEGGGVLGKEDTLIKKENKFKASNTQTHDHDHE